METIKAVIIDDEPGCISNLQCYIQEYCPKIQVIKTESRLSQIPTLFKEDIDVAFLDIEISNDNIFSIIQAVEDINFDIIFVTAYEKYAFKAFNVFVLDYILKPIRQESIINCYNKILRRFSLDTDIKHNNKLENEPDRVGRNIILKQGERVYVTALNDIVYMEAKGSYTKICFYQNDKKLLITVGKSLSEISTEYSYDAFYRIHRSFIVNKNRIAEIHKNNTLKIRMSTGELIPIARRRWFDFLNAKNK